MNKHTDGNARCVRSRIPSDRAARQSRAPNSALLSRLIERHALQIVFGRRVAGTTAMTSVQADPVVSAIIGAAIEVHRHLGPGLMESVYQTCLAYELRQRGLELEREVAVPAVFKGVRMECGFRLDLLVNRDVIVEVKCVETLMPIHSAQVITYLRLTRARQALLFNFNSVTLIEGMKSFLGDRNTSSR